MSDTLAVTSKWHIAVVKTIPYRRSASILRKLGYSFYLPLQKQLHYWSDRKRWVDVPIMSPYIFLFTSEYERKLLFDTCNFFRFLRTEGRLATAGESEIEKIKLLCDQTKNFRIESSPIRKGEMVTIIHGPLTGMQGYAVQENGKHRFLVHIPSLEKFASVDIDCGSLRSC